MHECNNSISANYLIVSSCFELKAKIYMRFHSDQREYTWEKDQCEKLFDDIQESENGYFLGSIICINKVLIQFEQAA